MTRERYAILKELFLAARDMPAEKRATYLDCECVRDADARPALERLLAADDDDESHLRPSVSAAGPASSGLSIPISNAPAPVLPACIGRYAIRGILGQGGMGVVYEAEQDSPRRPVAVKVLRPLPDCSERASLFRREIQALARLKHPGIAAIYEAGQTPDGLHYLAMECVAGSPLSDYVVRQPPDLRARLELFCQIADAVQYAHEHGIIHRDLKPSNILVDDQGRAVVVDFGVARIMDGDGAHTTLTAAGRIQGTLPYMSPEQVRGDSAAIDARSDVYALGVLLYELLSGRKPYDLDHVPLPQAARIICERMPVPPSRHDPNVRNLDRVVLRAIAKDREQRYASAAELAGDVRAHLAGARVGVRAIGRAWRWRKYLAASIALVFLVTLAAVRVFSRSGAPPLQSSVERASEAPAAQPLVLEPLIAGYIENLRARHESGVDDSEIERRLRAEMQDQTGGAHNPIRRLAQFLVVQGKLVEAEAVLREGIERFPSRLNFVPQLARIKAAQGDHRSAQELFSEAISRAESSGMDTGPQIAMTRGAYGYYLLEQGRFADSEPELLAAYDAAPDRPRRQGAEYQQGVIRALVQLYEVWGQPDKAEPYRKLLVDPAGVSGRPGRP